MNSVGPLVIGVGNPDRADDAAGWSVAQRLVDEATVILSSGDPASLLSLWDGRAWVVIVDAVTTGAKPGTVVVRELLEDPLPGETLYSSHGLGPVEAIEIGTALGMVPERITLVGVEAQSFDLAAGMTPAVEGAIEDAVKLVRSLLVDAESLHPDNR